MSERSMPASWHASSTASTNRSSWSFSQCSVKRVAPTPATATRSLMPGIPLLLRAHHRPAWRARLPIVVVEPGAVVQSAERQLDFHPDLHGGGIDVRHIEEHAPAAVEVDDDLRHRRLEVFATDEVI